MVHCGMKAMWIDFSRFVVPKELSGYRKGARTRYEQHQADSEKKRYFVDGSRKRQLIIADIKGQKLKMVKIEKNIE